MEDSKQTTEGKRSKIHVAHSNFRKGLNDYNDGCGLNHYLGNDDYRDGCNLPDDTAEGDKGMGEGKVALGNLIEQEEEDEV